ncbi:prepilin-type N-terminal cleavage/methylation domain-containing protein [Litoribacillus peritrichatus]|uniref:Type IV pilus modification protein PilV n=1 Tax=Litoribacillus peritrichatus TaxID=718191 RepID=A0ABP7NBF9_9GAMM
MKSNNCHSGFTLLEVLVASIIMMVSLLGLGALQSTSMQKNISAMHKTQAMESLNLLNDALRSQLSVGQSIDAVYDDFEAKYWESSNYQSHFVESCGSGCSRDAMVKHMLAAWEKMIGENLPHGRGKIEKKTATLDVDGAGTSTEYYEVTVMWDDRQLAQNTDGSYVALGTGCSGNPKVDLSCMKTIVLP